MSSPDVTTHTCHAVISHLASPDCHPRPTPRGFLSLSDPRCASPSDCASGERPQRLLTYRVCAATVPSDTQEGRGDIKVTGASAGLREPWQAPGHLS